MWERNELNQNSFGGTEMMVQSLHDRMPEDLMNKFQIIPSRVRNLREDLIRVLWIHDLPQDPETSHLKSPYSRQRFHNIVYCGEWQRQQYENVLGVPNDQHGVVIETAIDPIGWQPRSTEGPIKLVYTSTPQRGLELLYPAFVELAKHHDVELHVFSSFAIYGWPDADKRFENLFDSLKAHPKVRYHGFQPNDVVRETLRTSHILAYPSIWQECNSRSVVEAMSAGVVCVHPNYGGLPDTAGGLTRMYQWDPNPQVHVNAFYAALEHQVKGWEAFPSGMNEYARFVSNYADARFSWTNVGARWRNLLEGLAQAYEGKDLSLPKAEPQFLTVRTHA
jgi:UDP-glucose:(glucosyl)LPS alpha-1,2-glucosyltransferase